MTDATGDALGDRRWLIRMAAALGARREEDLRAAMHAALELDLFWEAEEVLVQSYLFVGYPMALNALALWRQVSGRPASPPQGGDWAAWAERGESVITAVYGGQYPKLKDNVKTLHADMGEWMVVEGYGKVLGRAGLSLVWRELAIVALLTVLDVPRQLYSHVRGALQVGASRAEVRAALEEGLEWVPSARARARVLNVWERFTDRLPHSATGSGEDV